MLYRIDYYILSALEKNAIVSMDCARTIKEIENFIKDEKKVKDRFALSKTIESRLKFLQEENYISKGLKKVEKAKANQRHIVITTWFITYEGIKLVKELEGENQNETISI